MVSVNPRSHRLDSNQKDPQEYFTNMVLIEPINSHQGSKPYTNINSKLWKPIKIGNLQLKHRIFMAPLTRMRAIGQVPIIESQEYYEQRATDGGMIVTEATFISKLASGYPNAPGIYTEEQIGRWKGVVEKIHSKGGVVFCQLWNIGITNRGEMKDVPIIGPGSVDSKGNEVKMMSQEDIEEHLECYKQAAKNCLKAGFDGVEVHAAHGYLLEQFLHPKLNNARSDKYSSKTLENRARFLIEALETVVDVMGQERVGIRLSPFYSMALDDYCPFEVFGYVLQEIKRKFPRLGYVSLTEPRWRSERIKEYSNDYFRAIIRGIDVNLVSKTEGSTFEFPESCDEHPTVIISAGGYSPSDAEEMCDRTGDMVGFGRIFISNPDLVYRLKEGLALNPYDRSTFYSQDPKIGYTDYPFADKSTRKFVPIDKVPIEQAAELLSEQLKKERKMREQMILEHEAEKAALRVKFAKL